MTEPFYTKYFQNLVTEPFYTKYFQNRISVYIEMPHLQPLVGFLADSPFNPTHTPLAPRWTAWLRKALFAHTVIMKLANSIVHQKCLVENESWIFENFFIQIYSKLAFKYFSNNSVLNNMIKIFFFLIFLCNHLYLFIRSLKFCLMCVHAVYVLRLLFNCYGGFFSIKC